MEASTLTHAHRRGFFARPSPLLKLQGDERLVALTRRGNQAAYETIVARYQPRLLAFCRQMLASQEDAEDILQEVFVAAYNAMTADERPIAVRPWLYRIARNRCLNHLRRPVPDGQDTMDVHPYENGATTHDRVQNREEFRSLLEDVGRLPETQRSALLLREIDAMSYDEIAQAMDTTVPGVKSLLVRARIALAESSEARKLTCEEVRLELAEAAEGLRKASGAIRRHVRGCKRCREFRTQLRSSEKALAAIFPTLPVLGLMHAITGKLSGIFGGGASGAASGGAASGGAAVGSAGSSAATGGAISGAAAVGGSTASGVGAVSAAVGSKATAGIVTAALITAGAVEMKRNVGERSSPAPQPAAAPAPAPIPDAATGTAPATVAPDEDGRSAAPVEVVPVEPLAGDSATESSRRGTPLATADAMPGRGSGNGSVSYNGGSASGGSSDDHSGKDEDTDGGADDEDGGADDEDGDSESAGPLSRLLPFVDSA